MSLFRSRVEQRQFKNIGTWMLAGKRAEVPEVLRGIFFMDGNSLPEDCMTMQGLAWDAATRTLRILPYAHLQWTFEDSPEGRRLMFGARYVINGMDVKFEDETLKKARMTPILFGFLRLPSWIRELVLIRAEDDTHGDTWYRRTFSGKKLVFEYTLRRIIRSDGQPTPAFEEMLAKLPDSCLVNVDKASNS